MSRPKRCPACRAEIEAEPFWFGLRRGYPSRCGSCGVPLAYDTAGGIYAVPHLEADDATRPTPRRRDD